MPKRRRRFMLAAIALVLLGVAIPYSYCRLRSPFAAVVVEQRADATIVHDGTLTVATYNIAHGRGGRQSGSNWKGGSRRKRQSRLEAIAQQVRDADADVVVLNEVDFSAAWSHNIDQAAIIADAAGYPYVVRQRNLDVFLPLFQLRFGNAILSRFPIGHAEIVRFEPRSRIGNWLAGNHDSVLARITLPDDTEVAIWAIHLDSRSRSARERAARAIRDRVVATEVPPVLAGDFNSTLDDLPETTAVEILAGTNLFSLVPPPTELAFTFPSEQPRRSIDWIMVPSRWNVLTHRVVPSKLSDHLMVTATVRPPPRSDDP